MAVTSYNERSWAIDLISEINLWANIRDLVIRRAGGEISLKTIDNTMFPDVLLYGDQSANLILQGWELKMPDTAIDDIELLDNAKKKAETLGLNSFLVWNVSYAALYIQDGNGTFNLFHQWDDLAHITKRRDVQSNKASWVSMLHKILGDLIQFFNRGVIKSTSALDSLTGNTITYFILKYTSLVEEKLKQVASRDCDFEDKVNIWWIEAKSEYLEYRTRGPWIPLSQILLVSWINKLIFAHLLKNFHGEAAEIDKISGNITIETAGQKLEYISRQCDFWNIFKPQLGEMYLPEIVWRNIVNFNEFLTELRLEEVDQNIIQKYLQNLVQRSKKKIAGQFATPLPLAYLLSSVTVGNKAGNTIDPCCGTGTIPKATYDLKLNYGLSHKEALSTTWASDKFSFPVQIATMSLTSPYSINDIIRVFREDAIDLAPGLSINLFNPQTGNLESFELPQIDYITSNLPFVQQETLRLLNSSIKDRINDKLGALINDNIRLDPRSDLFAYIPFALWSLLKDNGKMGIIVSNSWLATDWGIKFYSLITKFFNIDIIITSGKGRWFEEAKVVTNIIILTKRPLEELNIKSNSTTSFVTLNKTISDTVYTTGSIDFEKLRTNTSIIRTKSAIDKDVCNKYNYTYNEIEEITNKLGLGLNALFTDCRWLLEIFDKLIKVNKLFYISRGERRGWDEMFYPEGNHVIEKIYIKPVIKSPVEISDLVCEAKSQAFCCTESIEQLVKLNHNGALNWIKRFEHGVNNVGEPLIQSLRRSGTNWYTMLPNTLADLVMSINPDKRLFIAKLQERSFVNQRLTRFTKKENSVDISICHALLNSVLGIFYIEALGFGRGLGVLDTNSSKIKDKLRMLDPDLLSNSDKINIIKKFEPLTKRPVKPLLAELSQADRKEFDDAVLEAFGIRHLKDNIINSLLELYNIRKSVNM